MYMEIMRTIKKRAHFLSTNGALERFSQFKNEKIGKGDVIQSSIK